MYIGRFVLAGRTPSGRPFLGYRVSSRSFPNRRIVLEAGTAAVLPLKDAPPTDNPYISYNCLRSEGDIAVVANGSHTDPIFEKVCSGYPLRDALALSLLALDYEHDSLNTPRIAAAWSGEVALLGIVTDQGLLVQQICAQPGHASLIATYGLTRPSEISVGSENVTDLAAEIYSLPYSHPVAALAVLLGTEGGAAVAGPVRS
ncbi:MAG: IMP cyclohydrolase [Anaerolineae bacterium]|jgi:IMP cyclohydrolase|nr:IMP cyclohydrolase [Chloroflexota bacterium]